MGDKQHLFELYSNKIGKSNLLARLDFNRSVSEFKTLSERFSEIMGDNISDEELYQMYLDLRQSLGGKEIKKLIVNLDIEDSATLADKIKEIYGIDITAGEQHSKVLKDSVAYSKFGIKYGPDIDGIMMDMQLPLTIDFDIVQGQTKIGIETIYAQYGEQLFNMYANSSLTELVFEDTEEFQMALGDKSNEKHLAASLIGATQLTALTQVYSLNEMLSDEERVKKEMQIGLDKRILLEKRRGPLARTDYIQKREIYVELADSWDEADLDSYESIKQYANYLLEMLRANDIPEEKRAEMQDLYTKFAAISNLTIEETVQRQEQVRDAMGDGVLQYEILVRENLLDNIHEVNPKELQEHKIQYITDGKTEGFEFTGKVISSEAQLGTMLVHFFGKKDFTEKKELYGERVLLDLKQKRGLRSTDEISADDPEYVSAMKYYDDVIVDNTVVRGFDQTFRKRNEDGTLYEMKQKHSEHICAQTVSTTKLKGVQVGSYGFIFDKNGIEPEGIIMSSTTNLDSYGGIYNITRSGSKYGAMPVNKTSAPLEAMHAAEKPRGNNEVDLERNLVKPSGICYFGRNPLRSGERRAFLEVTRMAQKSGLPVVFVDMEAIEREQQAKLEMATKKESER